MPLNFSTAPDSPTNQPTAASILSVYTATGSASGSRNSWGSVCNVTAKVKKNNPIFHLSITGTCAANSGGYPEVRVVRGSSNNNLNTVVAGPYKPNNNPNNWGDEDTGHIAIDKIVNSNLNPDANQVFRLQVKQGGNNNNNVNMGTGCHVFNVASLRVMEFSS